MTATVGPRQVSETGPRQVSETDPALPTPACLVGSVGVAQLLGGVGTVLLGRTNDAGLELGR